VHANLLNFKLSFATLLFSFQCPFPCEPVATLAEVGTHRGSTSSLEVQPLKTQPLETVITAIDPQSYLPYLRSALVRV